ncbi:3-oxoacyl-[acyl-carrier-protein] synthase-3 [Microbacterium sp. AG790]|uniref:beta-ketoacyl-ACP synthase III n=1 Tax=Microbacterium sp. AG790 TaxID=2183995 RepID=UPI000F1C47F4|nr:beta-ketoacyl-ACP synthase III [Microbacterium sp. AG790]RKS85696.1 3-oxoacyl-[acyl-carrier-protein] synthase-3 [Microbacterium sp. AG790]
MTTRATSTQSPGFTLNVRMAGFGHYQPSRVVTNDDIAAIVDTNDEWIRQRVGIRERRFAETETVADMAAFAARDALNRTEVPASAVDLVIVATCTNVDRSPNTAGRVAEMLGLSGATVFDVNAACSGFVHAFALATQVIATGAASTALVIGSERLSDVTDWSDRSTSVLIADGAGAVILRASATGGVSRVVWGSAPGLSNAVRIERPSEKFSQDGSAVLRWAITEAAGHARSAIEAAGLTPEDIGVFVPHQANLRIIDPLVEQLGFTETVIARDIEESGNTSAASIPLALSKLASRGELPPSTPVLFFGFGGGFSYAGIVALSPEAR